MEWNKILLVICAAILVVGAIEVSYQIYHLTKTDAKARGLKHPKLWGFYAMNGNNSSGLLIYLIGRRKFPVINMTANDKKDMDRRKKSAGIGLIFLVIGAIGLIVGIYYL